MAWHLRFGIRKKAGLDAVCHVPLPTLTQVQDWSLSASDRHTSESVILPYLIGLCTLVAVAVFTAESWGKNKESNTQLTFEWSFYVAWAAFPMLLLAGEFMG